MIDDKERRACVARWIDDVCRGRGTNLDEIADVLDELMAKHAARLRISDRCPPGYYWCRGESSSWELAQVVDYDGERRLFTPWGALMDDEAWTRLGPRVREPNT